MDFTPSTVSLKCPNRQKGISFRLVDEHGTGKPYAGLAYQLHDSQGQTYVGHLDEDGYAEVSQLYLGVSVLQLSEGYSGNDAWYTAISSREDFRLPLTALQIAAEQTPSGPRRSDGKTFLAEARAKRECARFLRVEVSDFAEATGHLPERDFTWEPRPTAQLKCNAGIAQCHPGIALAPDTHHLLEVKALRAYSPLLSRDKTFCALNAYHLAVMGAFAYAPFSTHQEPGRPYVSNPPPYSNPGSIGHVLREQLARLEKSQLFGEASYHLLYEEVPYSKRLEVMPYDPERYQKEASKGWRNPEDVHFLHHEQSDTQAFITHNDKIMLISVRGTLGLKDFLLDADARQVPFKEGTGQAHRGFYNAFSAAKKFVERYMEAFYIGQTIIVCGHSLGGAVALLLSAWINSNWSKDTQLYTYGAPRAADQAFVQSANELTHHRLVNHNDPIPGVPFIWMDAEWKLAAAGVVALFNSPAIGISLLLGGLLNLQGDPYQHHGEQRHFATRKPGSGSASAVMWQPNCALIDEQACARYAGALNLKDDMPERTAFISQLASFSEHSSDSGYSRAMLTTMLRWYSSVTERGGALFTRAEITDIDGLIRNAEEELASWRPRSFVEFRHVIRLRHDSRFYNKTDSELMQLYSDGITAVRQLSAQQRDALNRARQRLLNEADRKLIAQDIFGDLWQRDDISSLIEQWLAMDLNRKAAQLAQLQSSPKPTFA
ncbi:lipase family protein [Stutzerimonas stutzeri]|uniref:lipase family protein n=1 Tax=Stutzerimonas stutzeri TaxID=316 RepID=UPI002109C0DE|nr:lipase family protein [Stutzerimonas stutzeri]MCQ4265455.1 lipase family protein [Stutzerimonas stutzeri]